MHTCSELQKPLLFLAPKMKLNSSSSQLCNFASLGGSIRSPPYAIPPCPHPLPPRIRTAAAHVCLRLPSALRRRDRDLRHMAATFPRPGRQTVRGTTCTGRTPLQLRRRKGHQRRRHRAWALARGGWRRATGQARDIPRVSLVVGSVIGGLWRGWRGWRGKRGWRRWRGWRG